MPAPETTPVSWRGWVRRGRGRWRLFCRGATREAVLAEMLNKAPPGLDKLAREGEADPNLDPGRRR
jgi:hypothetical protein